MQSAAHESPTAGAWLKALLLQLVDRALFDAEDLRANPDLALHRLRLRMKKADALLKLSKGAMRKSSRAVLRQQMKSVKNACGNQRDAAAVAELARELGRKGGLHLAQAPTGKNKVNVEKLRGSLSELRKKLAEEIFDRLTWEDVRDNYEACYRSGRRQMREAKESQEAEDLHRWRKRVKALYYQSQAVVNGLAHPRHRLTRTRKLGKLLGHDHDLTLLEQETARQSPDNPWGKAISVQREKLRRDIWAQAEKVYRQPPHRFGKMRVPLA